MAGIAIFNDLGQTLVSSDPVTIETRLESVKILPPTGSNDPELYGALTAEATSLVEITAPTRPRTFALAVTAAVVPPDTDDRTVVLGEPTSWSATVDALAAGRAVATSADGLVYIDEPGDGPRRLFLVAAGNVRHPLDLDHLNRSDVEPVEDLR